MFKLIFIITFCGILQIHAQNSHSRLNITPGILTRSHDPFTSDEETNKTLPVRERRPNSRGPIDSDGMINTFNLDPRAFPDESTLMGVEVIKLATPKNDDESVKYHESSENQSSSGDNRRQPTANIIDSGITTLPTIPHKGVIGDVTSTVNPNNFEDIPIKSSKPEDVTENTSETEDVTIKPGTLADVTVNPTKPDDVTGSPRIPDDVTENSMEPENLERHGSPNLTDSPNEDENYRKLTEKTSDLDDHTHGDHLHEPNIDRIPSNPDYNETTFSEDDNKKDLCSTCLCNPTRLDVYCKHEHLDHGESHHLRLNANIIPKTATSLHIEDFDEVTIVSGTFSNKNLELRKITFENIHNLHLAKDSLHFNVDASSNREVAVIFKDCNIKDIPTETLTQNARSEDQSSDIDLEDTRFLTLHFERCNITAIRSYALTKARLLYFKMSYTKVDEMEEHSFDVDVYEDWMVEYSHLPRLIQHTFSLRAQKLVVFSNNIFMGLDNRSLDIISSNQVLFEFNRVFYLGEEALMGILPEGRGSNMVFLNNTVHNLRNRSLIISRKYPLHERKILDNKFNILCECDIKERFLPLMSITSSSDHYDNETYRAVTESSFCRRYVSSNIYSNIDDYVYENCSPIPLPIIVSVAVVAAVIAVTVIVCIICTKRAQKAKEEANYLGECCYSHSFSTLNSANPNVVSPSFSDCGSWERSSKSPQPWVYAVPEVKTYQQTEVEVRYEQTDPLNASVRGSYQEPVIDFQRRTQVRASCPFN